MSQRKKFNIQSKLFIHQNQIVNCSNKYIIVQRREWQSSLRFLMKLQIVKFKEFNSTYQLCTCIKPMIVKPQKNTKDFKRIY